MPHTAFTMCASVATGTFTAVAVHRINARCTVDTRVTRTFIDT